MSTPTLARVQRAERTNSSPYEHCANKTKQKQKQKMNKINTNLFALLNAPLVASAATRDDSTAISTISTPC
jgi:hypothetical protein